MGWYYYVEGKVTYPFHAKCIKTREISPLEVGEKVKVVEQASEDECMREIFVKILWQKRKLAVPLAQLMPSQKSDAETLEAVADWHYWIDRGYEFG